MSSIARVASTIDVSQPVALQRPLSVTAPLVKPVQITVDQVKNADTLTRQLNSMQLGLAAVTHASRSHPEQAPITFKNVACSTAGAKVFLKHGFGTHVDFIVTMWKGATTVGGHSLVCDESDTSNVLTDNDSLALRSYVAGTANIRVFPRY